MQAGLEIVLIWGKVFPSAVPHILYFFQKDKENAAVPRAAPIVDTEKFRKPPTPLAPRKPKDQSDPMIEEVKKQQAKEQKIREQQMKAIKEQMAKDAVEKQSKVQRSPKQPADKEVRRSKEKSPEVRDKSLGFHDNSWISFFAFLHNNIIMLWVLTRSTMARCFL